MKFFILGDSWGVGEWVKKKNGVFESVPCSGLDHYLIELGHSVTNISAGSAGNFGQLRHAYWTLRDNADYDYIIWLHTESMRDIEEILINDPEEGRRYFPKFHIQHWESALDYLDFENYKFAQSIYDEFGIPFIVIGGQCPVNACIDQFSFAKYTITSWLAELLDLKFFPPKNTFFSWDKIRRILQHYKINERQFILANMTYLEQATHIEYIAASSELFPDNAHPSTMCHLQLAHRIIELIANAGQ